MAFSVNTNISKNINIKPNSVNANVIDYEHQKKAYSPTPNENYENQYEQIESSKSNPTPVSNISGENEELITSRESHNVSNTYTQETKPTSETSNASDLQAEAMANIGMGVVGFTNGVGVAGEGVIDGAVTGATVLATPFTWLWDQFTGDNATEEMWEASDAFVSEEYINNFYAEQCENGIFKDMNDDASDVMKYGGEGYMLANNAGYVSGILAFSAVGGGSPAYYATLSGLGQGRETALQEGANSGQALLAGLGTAAWEGLQWGAGMKLSGTGAKAVGFDTISGALDPVARSGIQTIYNGKSFEENFENAGGFEAVTIGGITGFGFSALGEIAEVRKQSKTVTGDNQAFEPLESDNLINESTLNQTPNKLPDLSVFELDANDAFDRNIMDALSNPIKNSTISDENVRTLLENLDVLKKHNNTFSFTESSDMQTTYWGVANVININPNNATPTTILHETGHALYHNFEGEDFMLQINPTAQMQETIQNAQRNFMNNPEKAASMLEEAQADYIHYQTEALKWYDSIRDSENNRISQMIDDLYGEGNTDELSNIVGKGSNYQIIKDDLISAGIDPSDVDSILADKDLVTQIAQREHAITKQNQYFQEAMSDPNRGFHARRTFSMINSIAQTTDITLPDGRNYTTLFGHSNNYWKKSSDSINLDSYRLSYDELMADYFSVSAVGDEKLINDLRELAGDELFDSLSNEYGNIIDIAKKEGLI